MSEVIDNDDEISLIDLAIALGEEKKTLFAVPAITTTLAIVVSLLMTPIFTAKTVMMPPQQQQSGAASALASLGGLAGLAGAAAGIKSADEMYVAFMQSEGLQNAVIKRLSLQERYDAKTMTDTRAALKGLVRISSDKKTGLITIEADDKDPAFAAQLANAQVEELRNLLGRLAVTDAQQRQPVLAHQGPAFLGTGMGGQHVEAHHPVVEPAPDQRWHDKHQRRNRPQRQSNDHGTHGNDCGANCPNQASQSRAAMLERQMREATLHH
jgi:capsular polysaccharide biosynthesis protein